MKKLHVLFVFTIFSSALFAQIHKGSVLLGGTIGLDQTNASKEDKALIFNISPAAGFFLSNRFALGGSLDYVLTVQDGPNTTNQTASSLAIGPFVRGYLNGKGNTRPFVQLNVSLQKTKFDSFDPLTYLILGLAAGADFIVNEHVAIEAAIYYQRFNSQKTNVRSENNFGLRFGVAAFIGREKEDTVGK